MGNVCISHAVVVPLTIAGACHSPQMTPVIAANMQASFCQWYASAMDTKGAGT